MICVGIDVAKDKHYCFILSSEGEVLKDVFTIPNNAEGFNCLLQTIKSCNTSSDKIKVGLEATGHYSYNILGFLLDNGLATYVINPLHTNLYRKSLSLRKTKTDRIDARTIATMLMSDVDLKSYTDISYHNEELKSLTRYRFNKVHERAKLKTSVSRLVCILFPELEKLVPTIHMASIYALLSEFPGAKHIADAHLTRLTNLLSNASKGRYNRDKAVVIRDAARNSIGSVMPAKSLELKHTIRLISELDAEIEEIENEIESIMATVHSPITTIPGIGARMGAMILAEVGDFSNFDSADKILAYAGMGGVIDLSSYVDDYKDLLPNLWAWLGEDNIYFYAIAEMGMFDALGNVKKPHIIANRHILFMDTKASSSSDIKPPMADELLSHYSAEQLRMHFISLGLSNKSTGFKPQVYLPEAERTGADPVVKEGSLLTNVYNRLIRSCFYTTQNLFDGKLAEGEVSENIRALAESKVLEYERHMYNCEFHRISYVLDEYIREINKNWAAKSRAAGNSDDKEAWRQLLVDTWYSCKVMAVLLHPVAPDGCEMFREYLNVDEKLWSWDYILDPLTAYIPDYGTHTLKFLEPRVDFFKKPEWQLNAQAQDE